MAILSYGIAHAAVVSAYESELGIPTFGDSSYYTLTKITDESSITKEDFVITKYFGDVSTGNLTLVKYLLTFNNPLGDNPNVGSPAARYFKWSVDENGNKILVNTGLYDTAKDITAYSSNNVRLDTTANWTDGSDVNNSFLYRGTASVILQGGAIYNAENRIVGNINGDFIGNYTESINEPTYGGAIYNANGSQIGSIRGNFIGNYTASSTPNAYGGTIHNASNVKIGNITGDFIGNFSTGFGGAISNECSGNFYIGNIIGDFIGNYALNDGGAMYFGNHLKTDVIITGIIEGNFINNKSERAGGAIYNSSGRGDIDCVRGVFIGNSANEGGAIYNYNPRGYNSTIDNLTADFIGNYASEAGGAIYNMGNFRNITGAFVKNYSGDYGGAIYSSDEVIHDSCFIENHTGISGGAIYTSGTVILDKVIFEGNYVLNDQTDPCGGGIYINSIHVNVSASDVVFNNNYAKAFNDNKLNIEAKGGAIYSYRGTLNIATNEDQKIRSQGNYAEVNGVKDDANGGFLYMADSALVNFNTEKGSSYIIGDGRTGYDSIASDDTNNIINKNGKGEVVVNSSMEFYKGILNVNEGNITVNNKLGASRVMIANGASLSAKVNGDGTFTNSALNFSNDGTLNLVAGENLATGNMGPLSLRTRKRCTLAMLKATAAHSTMRRELSL